MPRQTDNRPIKTIDVPAELLVEVRELARAENLKIVELLPRLLSMGISRYRALRRYAESAKKKRNT